MSLLDQSGAAFTCMTNISEFTTYEVVLELRV
jgi:hypothetical protein